MPDRVWRHKPAIEVHAFDLGVDRDDGRPVAEVDHCRIVSDADDYLPRVAVEFEAGFQPFDFGELVMHCRPRPEASR